MKKMIFLFNNLFVTFSGHMHGKLLNSDKQTTNIKTSDIDFLIHMSITTLVIVENIKIIQKYYSLCRLIMNEGIRNLIRVY